MYPHTTIYMNASCASTRTVGQACTDWHKLHRHTPRGLYIGLNDLGHVKEVLSLLALLVKKYQN